MFECTDGARIAVRRVGEGTCTLVLLHGWAMSSAYWNGQIEQLSKHYHVIAPDFRAHGASPPVNYGHRVARYAKDVQELICAFANGHPTWLIGWSMGASVAMSFLDLFPKHPLRGVVFVDQTPKNLNDEGWNGGVFDMRREDIAGQIKEIKRDFPGFLRQFVPAMFEQPLTPQQLEKYIYESRQIDVNSAVEILVDHCNQDWRDVIRNLRVPVLAVAGDRYCTLTGMRAMPEMSARVRLEVFKDTKHCPFIEHSERFEKLIHQFIKMTV